MPPPLVVVIYYDLGDGSRNPDEYLKSSVEQLLSPSRSSLLYEDINGDGEDDLIIYNVTTQEVTFVIIFIWQGSYYSEPFIVLHLPWHYGGNSRVYFEDWTGDDIADIVFDFIGYTGGTGAYGEEWFRHIIHCEKSHCQVVWHNSYAKVLNWYYDNGLVYSLSNIKLTTDKAGHSMIQTYSKGFDISMSKWNPNFFKVYTTTLSSYLWTGEQFNLISSDVITPAYIIQAQSILTATSAKGVEVSVSFEDNEWTNRNGVCQLFINHKAVSKQFGCKPNFTTVQWKDITNDGQPEMVVITLSAATANDTAPSEGMLDKEEECLYQRLLAYQWDGVEAKAIANIAGCVINSDLYGVRVEDRTGDGQPEILAVDSWPAHFSNDWYEPEPVDKIYKWNGTEFVLWKKVPRE